MDVWGAVIATAAIGMIQVDVLGILYYWNINSNAVSVVNCTTSFLDLFSRISVVMGTGMSVECCAHITRGYIEATKQVSRVEKVQHSMLEIGASVLHGAFTTLLGVIMLAFAKYTLFRVYYFRYVVLHDVS